jgi:SpoVK/Ycf46/Vps4 family AAA+-type ATPase
MLDSNCVVSDPQSFVSRVIQGSQQRPILLVNGETLELAAPVYEKVARLAGEVDPSVLCLAVENGTLANVEHESRGGLFVPVGVSVWWQGELAGSVLGDHAEPQLRQALLTASSRPPLQMINDTLQHIQARQHHFFHRAALPQIQPWVTLYLVNRHDIERLGSQSAGTSLQLIEIIRPVWLKNQATGALFVLRDTNKPRELLLKFATFDQQGRWQWNKSMVVGSDLAIDTQDKIVQNPQVAREDREFLAYTLKSGGQFCEFSIYKLSNDAAVLERALRTLTSPTDGSAPLGDRPTVLREAFEELDGLVGLETLKTELRSYANFIEIMQQRRQAGATAADITRHFVFKGSPGTGKTTVARIIGRILYGYGLLEKGQLVEVDRSGLVAGFLGQTAIKTTEAFDKALDGVFFIDEAYALTDGDQVGQDYGAEAIATLMALMENNRTRVSVIVAGYPEKMEQFLRSNPGLRSRFSKVFHFDDYSPGELAEVFERMAKSDGYQLEAGAIETVTRSFIAAKTQEGFGNARAARQLLDDSKIRHANRVASLESRTPEDLHLLKREDVVQDKQIDGGLEINEEGLANVLGELEALVGLTDVKAQIQSFVNLCRVQVRRQQQGHKVQPQAMHFAFTGNPGTGKTTVARLLGRIFAHLGLLSRGQLIEVSRSHLVAGYIGQTAIKTRGQIDRALDGVLFIDEAYALSREEDAEARGDFGAEAIEQILLALENERHRLSVVMAGYTGPMNRFLASNPGLRSRVSNIVEFPDYSNEELVLVFRRFLSENGYRLAETAEPLVLGYFRTLTRDQSFGNARQARQFFEAIQRTHASRMASATEFSDEDLTLFIDDDVLMAVGQGMGASAPRITRQEGYL